MDVAAQKCAFQCNKLYSHRHLFPSFTNPSSTTQLDRNTHASIWHVFSHLTAKRQSRGQFPQCPDNPTGMGYSFPFPCQWQASYKLCSILPSPCLSTMTVFSGSSVARSPEGMHDLFQAVLNCHKLFCPHFYFPSFYSCPALLPLSLQHFFIAVFLERYLLLSPCPWITAYLSSLSLFLFVLMVFLIFLSSICWAGQAFAQTFH